MRLVEEPKIGGPQQQGGHRHPPALAGRQPGRRHTGQPPRQPEAGKGVVDREGRGAGGAGDEAQVVGDCQVVVQTGCVAQQGHVAAHRAPVAPQVMAENRRLAVDDGHQPGAGAQQGRLTRAVRTLDEDDLASGHVEVDAGEGGEAAEEGDGVTEMDDNAVHGVLHATGGLNA